jgi:hypothetical protein
MSRMACGRGRGLGGGARGARAGLRAGPSPGSLRLATLSQTTGEGTGLVEGQVRCGPPGIRQNGNGVIGGNSVCAVGCQRRGERGRTR